MNRRAQGVSNEAWSPRDVGHSMSLSEMHYAQRQLRMKWDLALGNVGESFERWEDDWVGGS